jgi:hypothetical protein
MDDGAHVKGIEQYVLLAIAQIMADAPLLCKNSRSSSHFIQIELKVTARRWHISSTSPFKHEHAS